jgi:molecular chaperone DnaK (HSP70)
VAAALCYSSTNHNIDDELILVYDFGGGTFDLTLITKSGNQLHVIAKDGVNHLGGKEFDEIVSNSIRTQYQQAFQRDFPADRLSLNRLQKAAERIKIKLNDSQDPFVTKWLMVGRNALECQFHQEEYQSQAAALIAKTDAAVTRCLRSLGINFSEVHKMILIGGTSSSKLVYNYWKNKVQPHQQLIYHQPLSSVAKGAALYAASLSQDYSQHHVQPVELRSVSTYNIGLRMKNGGQARPDVVVHRNTPLPTAAKKMYKVAANSVQMMELELCQFWDESELQLMGTIKAGPFTSATDFYLEVHVENKLNGTIGIKLKNGDTGKDVRFEFTKKESAHKYDFAQQQGLVQNVYLNNNI